MGNSVRGYIYVLSENKKNIDNVFIDIKQNKIDKNVLGIQIRRTDATNSNYDNFIENFIKDCKKKKYDDVLELVSLNSLINKIDKIY